MLLFYSGYFVQFCSIPNKRGPSFIVHFSYSHVKIVQILHIVAFHLCVSIGLAIWKISTVGVACNPITNELFTAVRGKVASLNGSPIKTSSQDELAKAHLVTEHSAVPNVISVPAKLN